MPSPRTRPHASARDTDAPLPRAEILETLPVVALARLREESAR